MSNPSAQRRKYRRARSNLRSLERTAYRVGQPGENKFTRREGIHLTPGTLEGWHANESEAQRHSALRKVVRRHGYATVIRKLTLLGNLDENQNPHVTALAREDVAWVQKTFAERGY